MEKQFFIFVGRSGCGKGTQAELLKQYLEKRNLDVGIDRKTLHITTGGGFREFITSNTKSAQLAREVNDGGRLQPEFLAIWNWSNTFINTIKGDENILLDGAPRKLIEIYALHSALDFYGYKNVKVIYLDVTEEWAIARLAERGRADDSDIEEVKRKMKWFEDDVIPVVDWYLNDPEYKFIHLNGERMVEEIHQDLVDKIENIL